jgi:hypothetical protein
LHKKANVAEHHAPQASLFLAPQKSGTLRTLALLARRAAMTAMAVGRFHGMGANVVIANAFVHGQIVSNRE